MGRACTHLLVSTRNKSVAAVKMRKREMSWEQKELEIAYNTDLDLFVYLWLKTIMEILA